MPSISIPVTQTAAFTQPRALLATLRAALLAIATGNEVQTLTVGGTGLTSFTITYSGQTTSALPAKASGNDVSLALEKLSNVGFNNVSVSGAEGGPWSITYQGTLANTNVAAVTTTPTGGSGTVTVATTAGGGGGRGTLAAQSFAAGVPLASWAALLKQPTWDFQEVCLVAAALSSTITVSAS